MYWYEDEVKRLETAISNMNKEPCTVFYGSSTIRLWGEKLYTDFSDYNVINLGFGGSTLAACAWFFERIMAPVNADSMIIYAGDNDLGDGRCPEEVLIFFKQLLYSIRERYDNIPVGFISVKPSLHRWNIDDRIKHTNQLIEDEINKIGGNVCFVNVYDRMIGRAGFPDADLFSLPDGLHLNTKGYALWKDILDSYIADGRLRVIPKNYKLNL